MYLTISWIPDMLKSTLTPELSSFLPVHYSIYEEYTTHYCLSNNRYIQRFYPLYTCIWQHTRTFSDNTITVWNRVASVTHGRKHSSEMGWRMKRNHRRGWNKGSRKHLTGFQDVSHNETVVWVLTEVKTWSCDHVCVCYRPEANREEVHKVCFPC